MSSTNTQHFAQPLLAFWLLLLTTRAQPSQHFSKYSHQKCDPIGKFLIWICLLMIFNEKNLKFIPSLRLYDQECYLSCWVIFILVTLQAISSNMMLAQQTKWQKVANDSPNMIAGYIWLAHLLRSFLGALDNQGQLLTHGVPSLSYLCQTNSEDSRLIRNRTKISRLTVFTYNWAQSISWTRWQFLKHLFYFF